MDPARAAQPDKLLLRMEDHACSFVDQEKKESAQLNATLVLHIPNFPQMERHVKFAHKDGLLHQWECAQDAQLVSEPMTKELARETLSAHHIPDSQLMV